MVSVYALSGQFSYFIPPAHQHVELLRTVYTDRLRTERKQVCKCTATARVRFSHKCTDTALGEFFDIQSNYKLSA